MKYLAVWINYSLRNLIHLLMLFGLILSTEAMAAYTTTEVCYERSVTLEVGRSDRLELPSKPFGSGLLATYGWYSIY